MSYSPLNFHWEKKSEKERKQCHISPLQYLEHPNVLAIYREYSKIDKSLLMLVSENANIGVLSRTQLAVAQMTDYNKH